MSFELLDCGGIIKVPEREDDAPHYRSRKYRSIDAARRHCSRRNANKLWSYIQREDHEDDIDECYFVMSDHKWDRWLSSRA